MTRNFDLVVVGSGAAGLSAAYPCRQAGWSVAVVDSRPFGGTCANRGCDPKKVLVAGAEAVDWTRRMSGLGVRSTDTRIEWPELMRFKSTFTDPVPQSRVEALQRAGIEVFHGVAQFTGEDTLEIEDEPITAKHIVLATGATPAPLDMPGEELLLTSDLFLELTELPEKIAFVGGGYIAFEFAHLAARAGAKVIILHRGKQPLTHFDPMLVDMLLEHTRNLGIEVRLGVEVDGLKGMVGQLRLIAGAEMVEVNAAVHAAGRIPNVESLIPRKGNVAYSERGVTVNDYLQSTTNPRVYAAGDAVASGPPLTPVAGYHGRIVADNLLNGNRQKADYTGCPSVAFTLPPIASVGLSERAATEQGLQFDVKSGQTSSWFSSRRIAE
ncbi:MAG TPA: NAD(P)/FAD-dependent oxidoreductase, partial [Bryobacteraceae bacterium]|nr:NAD(P)/FAD-dependent oxidoreductase [Bryobacteraceae bacterium]